MSTHTRNRPETARPFALRSSRPSGIVTHLKDAPARLKIRPEPDQAAMAAQRDIDPATLPRHYALLLDGDCMQPVVPDRAVGVMDKKAKFEPGDAVCIWFRPERMAPSGHRAWLKRLTTNLPSFVTFPYREHPDSEMQAILGCEQINPPRRFWLPCTDIMAVHKVIGFLPPGNSRPGQTIDPKAMTRL